MGEKPRHGGNTEVGSNNDELTDLLNAEMDKEAEESPEKKLHVKLAIVNYLV